MIHPKAIVSEKAEIAKDAEIGPYCIVEENVTLGNRVNIGSYVHLKGRTTIGDGTFIATGCIIGEAAQMLGNRVPKGTIKIGKNNIIREYVTVNSPVFEDGLTSIGDDNFLMAFSHIAHDCNIANHIVICNGSLVAGHVQIGDKVFISGNVVIHQFVKIGRLAMIGGLSRINQDLPPFMMVVGDSKVWGINMVGLRRSKIERSEIRNIKRAYNEIYKKNLSVKTALRNLKNINSASVRELLNFIQTSKRGICGPKRSSLKEKLFLDYPYMARIKIPAFLEFLKIKKAQNIRFP